MQRKSALLLTGLLLFGFLAVDANYKAGQGSIGKDSLPPVETKPGFANYKPAVPGQTRVDKVGDGIQQKAGMEQPVYYWDPVVSPSGICFYKGTAIPEWKNNLFVACLSGQHVDPLIIRNNRVVGEERLLEDKNQRFRDVTYSNNILYAITDDGDIYKIEAAPKR